MARNDSISGLNSETFKTNYVEIFNKLNKVPKFDSEKPKRTFTELDTLITEHVKTIENLQTRLKSLENTLIGQQNSREI